MSKPSFSLGFDFGTQSVRALIVDISDGREIGVGVAPYPSGEEGILGDPRDPNVARQNPEDYSTAMAAAVNSAVRGAALKAGFEPKRIVGIGLDATASTPLPVDAHSSALALQERFKRNLNACAWLWKDHTAHAEAAEITEAARREHPEYLAKCGGTYSSEWFFSKLLHCLRVAPEVMEAAEGWVEQGDYIAGLLTGARSSNALKRGICAASHKAMYHPSWGLPSLDFLDRVDRKLGEWCQGRLFERAYTSDNAAGTLTKEWAGRLELPEGIPVAVAGIDAHVGAVGAGIRPGLLVKILGTSSCDMLVHPQSEPIADIPGICGIASGSILPEYLGLEAGQSAVGDIFAWFVREFGKPAGLSHEDLTEEASRLKPGESGLLALDWLNGNRNILADSRLTGCLIGLTLATRPGEVYRALLEATAFGARAIMERFEEYGVMVKEVVVCGGIAEKSPFLLQLYADVTGRPMKISRSAQTCALGAALFGAVVAGRRDCSGEGGGHSSVEEAVKAMTGLKDVVYQPQADRMKIYDELYELYVLAHDAFGLKGLSPPSLSGLMKKLLELREKARLS